MSGAMFLDFENVARGINEDRKEGLAKGDPRWRRLEAASKSRKPTKLYVFYEMRQDVANVSHAAYFHWTLAGLKRAKHTSKESKFKSIQRLFKQAGYAPRDEFDVLLGHWIGADTLSQFARNLPNARSRRKLPKGWTQTDHLRIHEGPSKAPASKAYGATAILVEEFAGPGTGIYAALKRLGTVRAPRDGLGAEMLSERMHMLMKSADTKPYPQPKHMRRKTASERKRKGTAATHRKKNSGAVAKAAKKRENLTAAAKLKETPCR